MRIRLLFLIATLTLTSCATMYTGSKQVIHFDSSTQGAEVYINNKKVGITPFTYRIKRKAKTPEIKFVKEGYEDNKVTLTKKFCPITLLSTIYMPLDFLSGAAWKYKENYVNAILTNEKTHKEDDIIHSLFYVLTTEGDTIYCKPNQSIKRKTFTYTDFNNQNKNLTWDKINGYQTLNSEWDGIFRGFFSVKFRDYYSVDKYLVIPEDTTKRKIIYTPLKEIVRNGEYSILEDSYTSATYDPNTGAATTNTIYEYFLYKGKTKVEEIKNKTCLAIAKKYFDNTPKLISMLEKKSKLRTFSKYYMKVRDPYLVVTN